MDRRRRVRLRRKTRRRRARRRTYLLFLERQIASCRDPGVLQDGLRRKIKYYGALPAFGDLRSVSAMALFQAAGKNTPRIFPATPLLTGDRTRSPHPEEPQRRVHL